MAAVIVRQQALQTAHVAAVREYRAASKAYYATDLGSPEYATVKRRLVEAREVLCIYADILVPLDLDPADPVPCVHEAGHVYDHHDSAVCALCGAR